MILDGATDLAAKDFRGPRDTRELELKLEIEPSCTDALLEHPLLRHAFGAPRQSHSVYYDTGSHALRSAGISLRVRQTGDRFVQTVKANAKTSAGLFDRSEWEQPIGGPAPDLDSILGLSPLFGSDTVRESLKPVFETHIERRACILSWQGARIEVVIDRGEVVAGRRRQAVFEVELELLEGSPQALFDLARSLQSAAPLRLGVLTKAERGARLAERRDGRATKAEPLKLSADMTVREGFQAIALACLRHFHANEPLIISARDVDALHQGRVALRRLRSALSLFKSILTGPAAELFRTNLRELSATLGAARNLDVLLRRRGELLSHESRERLVEERGRAYDEVIRALKSPQLQAMMLELVEWIALGGFSSDAKKSAARRARSPLRPFADEVLDRFWKKVKRDGRKLRRLSEEQRHELRIAGKKLRYAGDFFAGLYQGSGASERCDAFLSRLASFQERLGDLNDLATERELEDRLADLSIELPRSPDAEDQAALIERSRKIFADLDAVRPFWR